MSASFVLRVPPSRMVRHHHFRHASSSLPRLSRHRSASQSRTPPRNRTASRMGCTGKVTAVSVARIPMDRATEPATLTGLDGDLLVDSVQNFAKVLLLLRIEFSHVYTHVAPVLDDAAPSEKHCGTTIE